MKIGTVTFHCSNNYGAVLQSIALVEKLNSMGHDARIIDYRPKYKTDAYNPFSIKKKYRTIKHFLYEMYSIPTKHKVDKEFKRFNNKHMLTWEGKYYTSSEVLNNPPDLDVVITGSDQVWNPESLGAVDKVYFLGFGAENIKRISYAPSFGTAKVDERFRNEISAHIKNLNSVSVREIEGKKHIREMTGIEALHVLDPVFLLEKEKWNKYSDNTINMDEPYLLLYARERSQLLSASAVRIAKEKNLRIINISKILMGLSKYDKNIFGIGPGHFLELFRNASVVCTNSFHGTAFSIIYEKPFVVIPHRTRNTRIESILNTLDMSSQQITDIKQFDKASVDDLINYNLERVKSLLNYEREKSITFLSNALDYNTAKKDENL